MRTNVEDYQCSIVKAHLIARKNSLLNDPFWFNVSERVFCAEFVKKSDAEMDKIIYKATCTGRPFDLRYLSIIRKSC